MVMSLMTVELRPRSQTNRTMSEYTSRVLACIASKMVVAPVTRVAWREVDTLSETERGAGGFGSTGTGAGTGRTGTP